MAPVILVTFAGRQERMEILTHYVRKAIDDGIIDEWHLWDFTRSPEDHEWVTREFGPVRYMSSEAHYQSKGKVSLHSPFRMDARIEHDLHLALVPIDDPENCIEVVVGGWNNQHSAIRKIKPHDLKSFDRNDIAPVWVGTTPCIISPGQPNKVRLSLDGKGVPSLYVNEALVGTWSDLPLPQGANILVRGGWGADLELTDVSAPVKRYLGNPGENMPYWRAYDYYSRRLSQFSDAIFLKCDDDIVYADISKLSGFIEFRRNNPQYFVVSANVLNNGVCAYWQQAAGTLPDTLGEFERPPGGFGGTLWQSPERAEQLHDFFLAKNDKRLPLPSPVIDWQERQSINFISWLGKDLVYMAMPKGDDEYAFTVGLPTFLNRPTAIYEDFVVSHLSFGPQERGLNVERLISAYGDLMRTQLAA
ncbi:hypothetical protein [Oryzifoliimicrobium ureilyticus]|uniref:hypothetical protein n=1 Tax=Oryzifoliimicrobium ureilyticus TaxID=3113724 RepID=UPI003075FC33